MFFHKISLALEHTVTVTQKKKNGPHRPSESFSSKAARTPHATGPHVHISATYSTSEQHHWQRLLRSSQRATCGLPLSTQFALFWLSFPPPPYTSSTHNITRL
jgi:hypothetical protein